MHDMTKQNLKSAFAGESQAHMKYIIFSEIAEKEGKPNITRLFKAISFAEKVHAGNHLKAMGDVKSTADNLEVAADGENFEVNEMYPAYMQEALAQGEKAAEKTMFYALEAEKIHTEMYTNAKEAVSSEKDLNVGDIYICGICGHTTEDKAPEFCPICGAKSQAFKKF